MKIPNHLAVIMDGNGRWAKKRLLPRSAGHKVGAENLYGLAKLCKKYGVRYLTCYAFSTENWQRPEDEVRELLRLIPLFIDKYEDELLEEKVRVRFFGDLTRLSEDLQARIRNLEERSTPGSRVELNICFNYGARDELRRAFQTLCQRGVDAANITEDDITDALDSSGTPDPELLIRTGGEVRLSNFLLWQLAYTELYFTDCLWPDFKEEELLEAFQAYSERQRRFGRVTESEA